MIKMILPLNTLNPFKIFTKIVTHTDKSTIQFTCFRRRAFWAFL